MNEPRQRFKTFTYTTATRWTGRRAAELTSPGKPPLQISSPPEFKGEAGIWTPEDLFVSAIETCTMATFIALAEKASLPVDSYRSEATGKLEMMEGGFRFTQVVVKATVVIDDAGRVAETEQLLQKSHESCLVRRSVSAEVHLVTTVNVAAIA
jgi:organic hydroperoxide reductase OsmC/OhrA